MAKDDKPEYEDDSDLLHFSILIAVIIGFLLAIAEALEII